MCEREVPKILRRRGRAELVFLMAVTVVDALTVRSHCPGTGNNS